jgi:hypothetical protein
MRWTLPLCRTRHLLPTGAALALTVACATVHAQSATATATATTATDPAAEATTERVQVAAPFIELRTGPGRGYPVFHVVEKSGWITIETRRTDWYRVRSEGGANGPAVGWVQRAQLETTLTEAGTAKTFRDVLVDDYLNRRLEMGASWGRFEREPMLKVWGAWRLSETLAVEGSLGQVQGLYAGTSFWQIGLSSEPWSDQRLSPFFGVGVGRFRNAPNLSLVGAEPTDATQMQVGLGVRWYFSRRFVGRLDYTRATAFLSDERNGEYRSLTAGLSFFF